MEKFIVLVASFLAATEAEYFWTYLYRSFESPMWIFSAYFILKIDLGSSS